MRWSRLPMRAQLAASSEHTGETARVRTVREWGVRFAHPSESLRASSNSSQKESLDSFAVESAIDSIATPILTSRT
jgi:hypothetical protein